jgi:hypothetical protein
MAGSDMAGSDMAGSDMAGSDMAGSDMAGSCIVKQLSDRAVTRRDNWGGGVYIHIFMFTYRKNNRFQKKSVGQNTNI